MPDLNFRIEQQAQDQWCWAAVTISICRFYRDPKWANQCELVNQIFAPILGGTDCCQDTTAEGCNVPWALDEALNTARHLAPPTRGILSFAEMQNQILILHRPIPIRIMLSDLVSAHFVVIVGCAETSDTSQWVRVADPSLAAGNTTTIEYTALQNDYKPGASWDQSYFTT